MRAGHVILTCAAATIGLLLSVASALGWLSVVRLMVALVGIKAAHAVFSAIPGWFLAGGNRGGWPWDLSIPPLPSADLLVPLSLDGWISDAFRVGGCAAASPYVPRGGITKS